MKAKHWLFLVVFPLVGGWAMDQITKSWATRFLIEPVSLGPVFFECHKNQGFIFGVGSSLPSSIKLLFVATLAGLFLAAFGMIQLMIRKPYPWLRMGLSIFTGGILGNTTDRMMKNFSLDFISIRTGQFHSSVFNLADTLQWIGFAMFVGGLILYRDHLYPRNEGRSRIFINPRFQIRFFFFLLAINVGFFSVTGFFTFAFLRFLLNEVKASPDNDYLKTFFMGYITISFAFILLTILFSIRISHRIVGPMLALERYFKRTKKGEKTTFQVREGDETSHLEGMIALLKNEEP